MPKFIIIVCGKYIVSQISTKINSKISASFTESDTTNLMHTITVAVFFSKSNPKNRKHIYRCWCADFSEPSARVAMCERRDLMLKNTATKTEKFIYGASRHPPAPLRGRLGVRGNRNPRDFCFFWSQKKV